MDEEKKKEEKNSVLVVWLESRGEGGEEEEEVGLRWSSLLGAAVQTGGREGGQVISMSQYTLFDGGRKTRLQLLM